MNTVHPDESVNLTRSNSYSMASYDKTVDMEEDRPRPSSHRINVGKLISSESVNLNSMCMLIVPNKVLIL